MTDFVTPPDDIQYQDLEAETPLSVNQLKADGFKEVPSRVFTDHHGLWYFLLTVDEKTFWMPLRTD